MDYDELARLRELDPGWKLLRADTAPMVIVFLHHVFIEGNLRSVPEERLVELLDDELLDDELYALNENLGERKYPKVPKAYLDDWVHSDRRWLRKFYPEGGDQPHLELAPATERALRWVGSLHRRRAPHRRRGRDCPAQHRRARNGSWIRTPTASSGPNMNGC